MPKVLNFKQELTACFGQPVSENPTQAMVEAAYRHHGLDWRYLTIEVAPDDLAAAVAGARSMGFRGFNCTIPHKIAVIEHLDGLGESAALMGAVNCAVRQDDGQWIGENTDGKGFVDVARGDLDLGKLDSEEDKRAQEEVAKDKEGLVERLKGALGDSVADVRVSHRLTDSPAILAIGEQDLGLQMRQILEASGQKVPESKPIFEFNPSHPLIEKLDNEQSEDRFAELSHILFDQAALAAGDSLKDPAAYVRRLNKLLVELSV